MRIVSYRKHLTPAPPPLKLPLTSYCPLKAQQEFPVVCLCSFAGLLDFLASLQQNMPASVDFGGRAQLVLALSTVAGVQDHSAVGFQRRHPGVLWPFRGQRQQINREKARTVTVWGRLGSSFFVWRRRTSLPPSPKLPEKYFVHKLCISDGDEDPANGCGWTTFFWMGARMVDVMVKMAVMAVIGKW